MKNRCPYDGAKGNFINDINRLLDDINRLLNNLNRLRNIDCRSDCWIRTMTIDLETQVNSFVLSLSLVFCRLLSLMLVAETVYQGGRIKTDMIIKYSILENSLRNTLEPDSVLLLSNGVM